MVWICEQISGALCKQGCPPFSGKEAKKPWGPFELGESSGTLRVSYLANGDQLDQLRIKLCSIFPPFLISCFLSCWVEDVKEGTVIKKFEPQPRTPVSECSITADSRR